MAPEELTAAREAANLSKFALARWAGISRARVNDLERGHRPITVNMAARLREALERAVKQGETK
jgi:predicted transcriptional regulator